MAFVITSGLTCLSILILQTYAEVQETYGEMGISKKVIRRQKVLFDTMENTNSINKFHRACRSGFLMTLSGRCRLNEKEPTNYFAASQDLVDGGAPINVPVNEVPCKRGEVLLPSGKCRQFVGIQRVADEDYEEG